MVAIFKWRPFWNGSHFENSKTWMHLLRWGSTFLWSLVKIGSSVSENFGGTKSQREEVEEE
jgi:hypothetical protein